MVSLGTLRNVGRSGLHMHTAESFLFREGEEGTVDLVFLPVPPWGSCKDLQRQLCGKLECQVMLALTHAEFDFFFFFLM